MIMAFRKITKEFKDSAVEMYIENQNASEVAKELGVSRESLLNWVKAAGFEVNTKPRKTSSCQETASAPQSDIKNEDIQINSLLLNMAQGNDLTPFVGKDITKMNPREIFKFLELLNIEGTITIKQKVRLR